MRYLLFLLLLISSVTYSQSNVDFRGDSARFYKNGGSMEVIIRNSTKDSTNGVLTNIGNGITRFLKFRVSNDSLFLGNTFIGLIGGGSNDSTFLNFDLPPAYVIVDGDTTDVNVRQWVLDYLNDSLGINLVIVAEGASGDSLIRVQNDSLFQRMIRDSTGINKIIAPDGAIVFYSTAHLQNGNSFADTSKIGTNDGFPIAFEVNGRIKNIIDTSGRVKIFTGPLQAQPVFGAELLSASGWTSTNWTGSFAAGWTHTPGNTTALTNTLAASIGARYQIYITVSGATTGNFTITFGGQTSATISGNGLQGFGPTATTTGTLSINPSSAFDGTLIISVKQINATSVHGIAFYDQSNRLNGAIRFIDSTLQNTSIGVGAGGFLTNGFNNTNIGNQSGASITSGSRNTNIGTNAGTVISTGANNTNVGEGTGSLITTGTGNSNFGQGAGRRITTGASNTFLGNLSGDALTTGSRNVGVGIQALFANTTSSDNTGVGHYALGGLTTGATNTGLGSTAGRFQADGTTLLTTPGTSVYIGANTKGFTNGVANENVFGFNAIGAGSNTVTIGDNNITASYLKGSVAIGKTWTTVAPSITTSAIFEVTSTTKGSISNPVMTTAQKTAIGSPTAGLMVYDTDQKAPNYHDGTEWRDLTGGTGWEAYRDTLYTSAAPFTIAQGVTDTIDNRGHEKIATQKPLGVDSLYNRTARKIEPDRNGDAYNIQITFNAKNSNNAGVMTYGLDIGGTFGQIFKKTLTFPKGAATEHNFEINTSGYAAATFLANGGIPKITADVGDLEIYNIQYIITRTHKAR